MGGLTTAAAPTDREVRTRMVLRLACAKVGVDPAGATVIRLGENALFRLGDGLVARVARPGHRAVAAREVAVSRWLAAVGVPAVRTAPGIAQPVEVGDRAVTFWVELPPHRAGTVPEIAAAVRGLHNLAPPAAFTLGPLEPFARLSQRIWNATTMSEADRRWLRDRLAWLHARWRTTHDGHPGNSHPGDSHSLDSDRPGSGGPSDDGPSGSSNDGFSNGDFGDDGCSRFGDGAFGNGGCGTPKSGNAACNESHFSNGDNANGGSGDSSPSDRSSDNGGPGNNRLGNPSFGNPGLRNPDLDNTACDSGGHGLAPTVLHGDAWAGNVLRTADGTVLLADLERFAVGPPEWDLAHTAVKYGSLGWIDAAQYAEFCAVYGFDVTRSPDFALYRDIREFRMTCSAAQLAAEDPRYVAQAAHRLACLRGDHGPRPWPGWQPIA